MSDSDSAPEQNFAFKGVSSGGGGRRGSFSGRPREFSSGGSGVLTRSSMKKAGGILETEDTPPATNVSNLWDSKESARKPEVLGGKGADSTPKPKKSFNYGVPDDSDVSGSESYLSSGGSFKSNLGSGGSMMKEKLARPESYVDLTSPDCCRVRMRKTLVKGRKDLQVSAVCGLSVFNCSRRSHENKRAKGIRGEPGFYFMCLSTRGVVEANPDGRADLPVKTSAELADMAADIRRLLTESVAAVSQPTSGDSIQGLDLMSTYSQGTSGVTAGSEVRVKDLFSPSSKEVELVGDDDSDVKISVGLKEPPADYVGESEAVPEQRAGFFAGNGGEEYYEGSVMMESLPDVGPASLADMSMDKTDVSDSVQSVKLPFQSPIRSPPKIAGLSTSTEKSGGNKFLDETEVPVQETSKDFVKNPPPFNLGGDGVTFSTNRQNESRGPSPNENKTRFPPKIPKVNLNSTNGIFGNSAKPEAPNVNDSRPSDTVFPTGTKHSGNDMEDPMDGIYVGSEPSGKNKKEDLPHFINRSTETTRPSAPNLAGADNTKGSGVWLGFVNRKSGSRRLEGTRASFTVDDFDRLKREGEDLATVFSSMAEAFAWLEEVVGKPPPAPVKVREDKVRPPTPYIPINYGGNNRPKVATSSTAPQVSMAVPQASVTTSQVSVGTSNRASTIGTGNNSSNGGYETETLLGTEATATSNNKRVGFLTPVTAGQGGPGNGRNQLWYGLLFRASAQRIIVTSVQEMANLCNGDPPLADLVQIFTVYEEALEWSKQVPKRANDKKKGKDGSPPSDDPSSSSSSDDSSFDSDEDDSSSVSDSDDSSGSSTSDESDRKRKKKQEKKKRKSKDKKRRSSKLSPKSKGHSKSKKDVNQGFREKVLNEKFQGDDPSVGKDDEIFGIGIADVKKLDRKLCPPDLCKEDRAKFLQLTPDITSLPGMYLSSSIDTSMEYEMVSISLAQGSSRRGSTLHDTMWRHKRKHSLGNVKTQDDLISMVEQVDKAGKMALGQFKDRVRAFMLARKYSKNSITLYLQAGLLPRIVQFTLRNFQLLLEFLRSLCYKHGFEMGPARYLLYLHAEKLGEKRFYAHEYRYLVLGAYVLLREAHSKSFAIDGLLTACWDQFHRVPPLSDTSTTPTKTPNPNPPCSHCKTKTLHNGGKNNCDLKDLPPPKAKAAAREVLAALGKDSSLDKAKLIADAIKKAKE